MSLLDDLEKLLEKYPDPRKGEGGKVEFRFRKYLETRPPVLGIVVDNKDPACLGRVRVAMDMLAPGAVGPWYQILNHYAGKDHGIWQLPDIGTQVLAIFPGGNVSQGVVVGSIYDQKHKPPKHDTDNPAHSILYQTKNHRIELIDEDGKEGIHIETAKGQMRCYIDKAKGISIVNELGDVKIKCRKFTAATDKNIEINAKKKFSLTTDGTVAIKASKQIKIENSKDVTIKGKNVKLSGTQGVTTGGKQLAVQGDKVMGFDVHQMVVPSGNGTAVVPLPHPYIGKINDKVSSDVKIKGKGAATKGSKSKHDNPTHMQLPGTIKFQKNPNKEGEVTGGTAPKLKIDGAEAAVIGSMVTTCNDVGAQNNSVIMAVGASMPMPTIINPKNTEQYKRDKAAQQAKQPQFKQLKWSKTSVKEGEEVTLSAGVKDINDGEMVTLQVFHAGQDPASGVALARIPCTVSGGSAQGTWFYRTSGSDIPPASDPSFIFRAHSAWCQFATSGSMTVELIRPEITKTEWQDADGNTASTALVGDTLKLSAETKDLMDGAGVMFAVYDSSTGEKVAEPAATMNGTTAEAEWTWHYKHDPDNPLTEKPTFYFTADTPRVKQVKSRGVEIGAEIHIVLVSESGLLIKNAKGMLSQADTQNEITISDGKYDEENDIPGEWTLTVTELSDDEPGAVFTAPETAYIARKCTLEKLQTAGIIVPPDKTLCVLLSEVQGGSE
jgi:phage baseplate assembly protein V